MIEGSDGRVNYHKCVDQRVENTEEPDGRGHETNSSPHANHSTSVMVRLQKAALLSFGNDNGGINNFIELAQVEQPSVECKTLLPHSDRSLQ